MHQICPTFQFLDLLPLDLKRWSAQDLVLRMSSLLNLMIHFVEFNNPDLEFFDPVCRKKILQTRAPRTNCRISQTCILQPGPNSMLLQKFKFAVFR